MAKNNALVVSGLAIGGLTGGVIGAIVGGVIGAIIQEIICCPRCGSIMKPLGQGWLKCSKCGYTIKKS